MWYQNIEMLIKTKKEKNDIETISPANLSKLDLDVRDKSIRYNIKGKVIKKIYIPESRCVIDENADIGSLILVKSRYTGLSCIVCLIININNLLLLT